MMDQITLVVLREIWSLNCYNKLKKECNKQKGKWLTAKKGKENANRAFECSFQADTKKAARSHRERQSSRVLVWQRLARMQGSSSQGGNFQMFKRKESVWKRISPLQPATGDNHHSPLLLALGSEEVAPPVHRSKRKRRQTKRRREAVEDAQAMQQLSPTCLIRRPSCSDGNGEGHNGGAEKWSTCQAHDAFLLCAGILSGDGARRCSIAEGVGRHDSWYQARGPRGRDHRWSCSKFWRRGGCNVHSSGNARGFHFVLAGWESSFKGVQWWKNIQRTTIWSRV